MDEKLGLKGLLQKARELAPLVEKQPFAGEVDEEEVRVTREKLELMERLSTYSRSKDIYADFSADAAKQLVFEAKYGKSSADRTRASEAILDRAEGKPVNRQLSMTVTPSDFEDGELVNRTLQLASELGIAKDIDATKLIIGPPGKSEVRTVVPDSFGPEGGEGPEPFEESGP